MSDFSALLSGPSVRQQLKDMFFIVLGILLYAFGYTAFILPEEVVMGGVTGISALLFYAFGLPAGASIFVLNTTLLLIACRALTRQFTCSSRCSRRTP